MAKRAFFLMSFLAMMALAAPAFSADGAAPAAQIFGIVDMNKVMQTTEAAKDIFSQMEVRRKQYQTDISKEETALRAAEQDILKQRESLSKEAFEKKRKEFEEKVVNGQKFVQDRKRILDQAFSKSMGTLRNEAIKVVADIAETRKYSAVFTQDAVMISAPGLDMTGTVIEQLNKNVKKIPIDWSASTAAAGTKK